MKKPETKTLAVGSLIEDFSIYPRHQVDETHIADLVRAIRSGVTLPPLVAEARTLRLVDGVHRRRGLLKHLGPKATHPVQLRQYLNEGALFLDAVTLNAHHGRKLDRQDHTRIVLRLRELSVPDHQIAVVLHVPESQVKTLAVRVVYGPSGEVTPLKRGLEHERGQTLTDDQLTVMGSVRSAEVGRLSLELTRLLDVGLANLNDPEVMRRLRSLRDTLLRILSVAA